MTYHPDLQRAFDGDQQRHLDAARDAHLDEDPPPLDLTPAEIEEADGRTETHHPKCYQNTGVPDDLPPGLCDCRILWMLDAWQAQGELDRARRLAGDLEAENARLTEAFARVRALVPKWAGDRLTYPVDIDAQARAAHVAVEFCEQELRVALDGSDQS